MMETKAVGFLNNGFDNVEMDQVENEEKPLKNPVNEQLTHGLMNGMKKTNETHQLPALEIRAACKKYKFDGSVTAVLNNFNMTVKQGSIYSLLGASGCGKTTVLSCCVGLRHLDSGNILTLGTPPGTRGCGVPGKRVGYMPQEMSLYGEFTIKESLQYFGRVYGMTQTQVEKSMEFLLELLDLPSQGRRINTLSGGQKRRVSFAVALIHDPELLILDEPTVGVDPLLRASMENERVDFKFFLNEESADEMTIELSVC